MPESSYCDQGDFVSWTADAAYSAGVIIQLPDGRAGQIPSDCVAADVVGVRVRGRVKITKTASMYLLPGGRVYWDHSANAGHYKKVNDRDFYVGRNETDAAAAATTCYVHLNVNPPADIDLLRDAALSVATGTKAAGGFDLPKLYGGSRGLSLTATSEAQCVDMLSVDRFALGANWIAEFIFRLGANGSTGDVDINLGVANGTSTSDADAITESAFFHIDGGALHINAESDDGVSVEVSATDTTVDASAGSAVSDRFELWLDGRDPSDVKFYINGVEYLAATANLGNIAAATGPLGLLVHLEKASGTATAGPLYIDRAEARLQQ